VSADFNPYAPPVNEPLTPQALSTAPLATRSSRLSASFIDGVGEGLLVLLLSYGLQALNFSTPKLQLDQLLAFLFYTALNWPFYQKGTSIGKHLLGIQVRRRDDTLLSAPALLLKRILPYQLAYLYLYEYVPVPLMIFGVIDALMIYGESRTTLHDWIAGTKVVKPPRVPAPLPLG
jgi:uncharacterized RDD family membrane protein YckC